MTAVIERISKREINFEFKVSFSTFSATNIALTEEQSTWEDWKIKGWLCRDYCIPLANEDLVRQLNKCCISCAKRELVKNCIGGCEYAKSIWKSYNEVALYSINDINNSEMADMKAMLETLVPEMKTDDANKKIIRLRECVKTELGYRNLCKLFYRNFAEMNLNMIECLEIPLRLAADDVMEKAEDMTDLTELGCSEGWYMGKCKNLKTDYENFAKMKELITDAKKHKGCGK